MKEITKVIIKRFRITKKGYDCMGYPFVSPTELSYHHTKLEKNEGGEETVDNGVVLVRKTAHDYVHIIEKYDNSIYERIRELLIKEIDYGLIDINFIEEINNLLSSFEEKHCDDTFKDGKLIIRDEYKVRLLNKKEVS